MLYHEDEGELVTNSDKVEELERTEEILLATLNVMHITEPAVTEADLSLNSLVGLDSLKAMKLKGQIERGMWLFSSIVEHHITLSKKD